MSRTPADWAPPLVAVLLLLALWELVVQIGLISETSIPPASAAIPELFAQLVEASLWKAIGNTLQGWVIGLGIAIAAGVPAGLLIGSSRWAYRAFRVPIEFLRPIPSVALIPLAVLIYGTGLAEQGLPRRVRVVLAAADPDDLRRPGRRPRGDRHRARVRARAVRRMWRVTVPSAVPYIATGIRIASAVALILAVTAELVIGSAGLGREINSASSGGNVDLMYALILATGLLGWALNLAATAVEKRVLHWHPSQWGAVT